MNDVDIILVSWYGRTELLVAWPPYVFSGSDARQARVIKRYHPVGWCWKL